MSGDQATPDVDALLDDLARAEQDMVALAGRHGLSLGELIAWSQRPDVRRSLAGLCVLGDAHAQMLMSRYRLLAATRLIAQVTAEADALPAEQVRKACVDLLKIELPRADALHDDVDLDEDVELEALRDAVYGTPVEAEPESDRGSDAQADHAHD